MTNKEAFALRLSKLRIKKDISARDMSLTLGQSPAYINNIETGLALPSMNSFFNICDFLEITPQEFFNYDNEDPKLKNTLYSEFDNLTPSQMQNLTSFIKSFTN